MQGIWAVVEPSRSERVRLGRFHNVKIDAACNADRPPMNPPRVTNVESVLGK